MSIPDDASGPKPEGSGTVGDLLASPQLARAVETADFKRFLDHLPIALAVSRAGQGKQRIFYVNAAFETLFGRSAADIQGKTWQILDDFLNEAQGEPPLGRAILNGEDFLGVFRRKQAEGGPVVQAYASIIEDEDGSESYRIIALVDVTAQDQAQRDAAQRQIAEKDLMLRELQHRVKNNLQLIVALLRMESRSVQKGEEVDLDRLAGRVQALALLYSTLAAENAGPDVDLGLHLSQIAGSVLQVHGLEGVRLDLKIEHCPVSINIAMPAGLVVNEILTNAFKYAFSDGGGSISLSCVCQANEYRIVVADDGRGLPPGIVWPEPGKLSALMLQTLRENAKADVSVESMPGRGLKVAITFRHIPPSRRGNRPN